MEKEKKEGEEKEEKGGTICQESFVFFERKGMSEPIVFYP